MQLSQEFSPIAHLVSSVSSKGFLACTWVPSQRIVSLRNFYELLLITFLENSAAEGHHSWMASLEHPPLYDPLLQLHGFCEFRDPESIPTRSRFQPWARVEIRKDSLLPWSSISALGLVDSFNFISLNFIYSLLANSLLFQSLFLINFCINFSYMSHWLVLSPDQPLTDTHYAAYCSLNTPFHSDVLKCIK